MGKKLDALLGRTFKASKFKPVVTLAFSRLAVFKTHCQVRCSQDRSDVVQLLQLGNHERALLRVEHVIKEQSRLDVYAMIEAYLNILIERLNLIEQERECPDELKEPISSLIYAASRVGDFPELQEIRSMLTSRFGKEFAARAIDLRNNCGVNLTMITKLSTRQPNLESRMKVLKEIASENNIVLQLEEAGSISIEENMDVNKKQNQHEPNTSANSGNTKVGDNLQILHEEIEKDDRFSDSMKTRRKYRDVAAAAQAAFESAAYAAEAARAAVELSRSEPHDPDDQGSPSTGQGKVLNMHGIVKPEFESINEEILNENRAEEMKQKNAVELKRSISASSSNSSEYISKVTAISSDDVQSQADPFDKELHFDESDNETENEQSSISPHKQIPSRSQVGLKVESSLRNPIGHVAEGSGAHSAHRINIEKRPISVRTRQVRGY